MRKFQFKKLVRDKIIEAMLSDPGQEPDYRTMDDTEYEAELKTKLVEEVAEIAKAADDELIGELADIEEIIDAILKLKGFTREQLQGKQNAKRDRVGGFEKRAYVESVSVEDNHELIKKYQEQPEKYPELFD